MRRMKAMERPGMKQRRIVRTLRIKVIATVPRSVP